MVMQVNSERKHVRKTPVGLSFKEFLTRYRGWIEVGVIAMTVICAFIVMG